MSDRELKPLEWKEEDFVNTWIPEEEWVEYLKKYPNLAWGTHISDRRNKEILVRRFINVETCIRYCTAPTLADLGHALW